MKVGVLPTETPVHDSICCKPLFSCTLARGESYPPKFQCMTTDVETTSFLTISKRAVLTTQTPLHDSRCCKPLLPFPLAKGESYPTNYQCMTTDVETTSLLTNSKGGVLPTQTPVHYSLCCKPLLSLPLARGESYPPKLQCMIPDVANHFSPAHQQGGSLTYPKSSA